MSDPAEPGLQSAKRGEFRPTRSPGAARPHAKRWRPVIAQIVHDYLACGDLQHDFSHVRCPRCRHEFFVAFSCRRRCLCPSCHQKRALLTG